jgi:hypothetical protein
VYFLIVCFSVGLNMQPNLSLTCHVANVQLVLDCWIFFLSGAVLLSSCSVVIEDRKVFYSFILGDFTFVLTCGTEHIRYSKFTRYF